MKKILPLSLALSIATTGALNAQEDIKIPTDIEQINLDWDDQSPLDVVSFNWDDLVPFPTEIQNSEEDNSSFIERFFGDFDFELLEDDNNNGRVITLDYGAYFTLRTESGKECFIQPPLVMGPISLVNLDGLPDEGDIIVLYDFRTANSSTPYSALLSFRINDRGELDCNYIESPQRESENKFETTPDSTVPEL